MSSSYCAESDMIVRFGAANVDEWADINNDAVAATMTTRKNKAIEMASDEIDNALRRTAYKIPIQDAAGTTPGDIVQIAAALAGEWLYEQRGAHDYSRDGTPEHGQAWQRKWALGQLEAIRTGHIRLDAVYGI